MFNAMCNEHMLFTKEEGFERTTATTESFNTTAMSKNFHLFNFTVLRTVAKKLGAVNTY